MHRTGTTPEDSPVSDELADDRASSDDGEPNPYTPDVSTEDSDEFMTEELAERIDVRLRRGSEGKTYRRERQDDHDGDRDCPGTRGADERNCTGGYPSATTRGKTTGTHSRSQSDAGRRASRIFDCNATNAMSAPMMSTVTITVTERFVSHTNETVG